MAVLSEDQGLIPSTNTVVNNHSVTSVPEDSTPSSGLQGHQAGMWYAKIYPGKIPIHTKISKKVSDL